MTAKDRPSAVVAARQARRGSDAGTLYDKALACPKPVEELAA